MPYWAHFDPWCPANMLIRWVTGVQMTTEGWTAQVPATPSTPPVHRWGPGFPPIGPWCHWFWLQLCFSMSSLFQAQVQNHSAESLASSWPWSHYVNSVRKFQQCPNMNGNSILRTGSGIEKFIKRAFRIVPVPFFCQRICMHVHHNWSTHGSVILQLSKSIPKKGRFLGRRAPLRWAAHLLQAQPVEQKSTFSWGFYSSGPFIYDLPINNNYAYVYPCMTHHYSWYFISWIQAASWLTFTSFGGLTTTRFGQASPCRFSMVLACLHIF